MGISTRSPGNDNIIAAGYPSADQPTQIEIHSVTQRDNSDIIDILYTVTDHDAVVEIIGYATDVLNGPVMPTDTILPSPPS